MSSLIFIEGLFCGGEGHGSISHLLCSLVGAFFESEIAHLPNKQKNLSGKELWQQHLIPSVIHD